MSMSYVSMTMAQDWYIGQFQANKTITNRVTWASEAMLSPWHIHIMLSTKHGFVLCTTIHSLPMETEELASEFVLCTSLLL